MSGERVQRVVRVEGRGTFMTAEGIEASTIAALIDAHHERARAGEVLKRNLGTVVTRVRLEDAVLVPSGGAPRDVVVKEAPVPARRWLAGFFPFRSPLRREFGAAARLEKLGIPCSRPIAASLAPAGGTQFLVTELVEGAETLRDLLWAGERPRARGGPLEALLAAVGEWLRALHERGVWQRDMKPGNVLVRGAELVLIDLTAVRFFSRPIDHRRRVRNLAQILDLPARLDAAAREPLLRGYLGGRVESLERWGREVGGEVQRRRDRRARERGWRYVDEERAR